MDGENTKKTQLRDEDGDEEDEGTVNGFFQILVLLKVPKFTRDEVRLHLLVCVWFCF